MAEPRFIWDENKNRANIKKHGISFKAATAVWLDPYRVTFFDEEHSIYEERWVILKSR